MLTFYVLRLSKIVRLMALLIKTKVNEFESLTHEAQIRV